MAVIVVEYSTEGEKVLHALDVIDSTEGRWFRATFARRTKGRKGEPVGSLRSGTFRTGVNAYVKGVGLSYEPEQHDLRGVWEAGNADGCKGEDAYRMVNLRGITEITADGNTYIYRSTSGQAVAA